ncbi:MAG TPA: fructosamine kinase family protein [Azoarcus sp.]|nr:fructosamine kinase family protein [Azoarcus sp.]
MRALGTLTRIESTIREAVGNAFRLTESRAAFGGDTHSALIVAGRDARYFVKHGGPEAREMFAAEVDGLAALAETGAVRTPAVIGIGADDGGACLVLEHLELRKLESPADGERFAEALSELHGHTGERFGWPRDNFIGRTPQPNTEGDSWARFFARNRLAPQLALARANGFDGNLQYHGERLVDRLAALFLEYNPKASLLHGDLWHGNAAMTADNQPALFDPAVHRGDRESDLAMCELFGGFPLSFYAAYRRAWPLNPGYESRKTLYALYHVLNHLNLFGRGYLREAERLAAKIDHELGTRRE